MSFVTGIPLISLAIEPNTPADAQRLADGLAQLLTEDAWLRVQSDRRTGRVVVSTGGEEQLDMTVDRLKRDFNVEAEVGRPRVLCREALRRAAEGEAKHVGWTGGRRLYAHVKIRLHPGEAGAGYVFENQIVGGAIPAELIAAVDDGIQEALTRGVLAGYPIADARVELYDGSYHDVDSTAEAFRTAGFLAARDAAAAGEPVVLEPVMRVEIVAPPDSVADVLKNPE